MNPNQCHQCGAARQPATRFCGQCGVELSRPCPACRFDNPPANAFCGGCGETLESAPPVAARQAASAERRRITVLFCDLVGSTALSTQLDPESLRTVILAYQRAADDVIEHFGGHVAQYLGDGMMVYFGFPRANEDDPVRAVHAGLGLVEAARALPGLERDSALAVRVGIHSGPVVAGAVGGGQRREQLALGQTPNLAARLQGLAEPNTVVVSRDHMALTEAYFQFQPLGEKDAKGFATPIEVFRAVRGTGVRTRFDVSRWRGLADLVGRKAEIGLLRQWFEAVEAGRARAVLLVAEAGMGKSRLLEELRDRTSDRARRWLSMEGSDYHRDSPFHPVAGLLRQLVRATGSSTPDMQLEALRRVAADLPGETEQAVALLAPLMWIPPAAGYAVSTAPPQRQMEQTLELLIAAILAETEHAPVVLAAEDMHWLDASTLDLLGRLIQRTESARLLVVMTARPSFTAPWESQSRLSQVTLDPLDRDEVNELIGNLAGDCRLEPGVAQTLIDRSDGVPLYIEELTRAMLGATPHDTATPATAIPASLEDSLRARLDQLSGAKEVVQHGAAIGREFAFDLLVALIGEPEETIRSRLDELVAAEILAVRGLWPDVEYVFRHALIHEAAYDSLLASTQAELHLRVGELLVSDFAERSEAHPEITARHFTRAGDRARALDHWECAGQRSAARFANVEAVALFRQALDCLDGLEEGQGRKQRELTLLTALAPALVATKGYGAEDVAHTYDRAHALCRALGATQELFGVLWGLAAFYQARGPIAKLVEIAEQMEHEAEQGTDEGLVTEARFALGAARLMGGDYEAAADALTAAATSCREHPALAEATSGGGSVRGTNVLLNLAIVHTTRGDLDEGKRAADEGVALARRVGNPFNLAAGLVYEAWRAQIAGDPAATERAAREALSIAAEFPFWAAWAAALVGWVDVCDGRADDGLAALRGSISGLEQAGVRTVSPLLIAIEADAFLRAGRWQYGFEAVDAGLQAARLSGAHGWDAELLRLRAELERAAHGPGEPAREAFASALETARRQGAGLTEGRVEAALQELTTG